MSDESVSNMPIEKQSFFKSIPKLFVSLINIFKSSRYRNEPEAVAVDDEVFDSVKAASSLCDTAISIVQQRVEFVERHKEILINEQNLNKFDLLSMEEIESLKELVSKVDTVIKEKVVLKNQLGSIDRSLDYLARYEDQFPKILNDIKEAEERQRLIKVDISTLEGERASLQHDKVILESGLDFIYKSSIFLICFFSFFGVMLVFLNIFYSIDIFMIASIEVLLAIFLGSAIYIFNRRMKYDLKKNVLLQIKVVELLNKRKLHFVHHTTYLNYEFKKFHVRSANNLKNNWEEYCYYKHLSGRFKTINNIIFDLEDDIQRFLIKRDITDSKYIVDNITKLTDKNNLKKLKKELVLEKKNLEEELDKLDTLQSDIWKELIDLRDNDTSADKIIEKMIADYFSEGLLKGNVT